MNGLKYIIVVITIVALGLLLALVSREPSSVNNSLGYGVKIVSPSEGIKVYRGQEILLKAEALGKLNFTFVAFGFGNKLIAAGIPSYETMASIPEDAHLGNFSVDVIANTAGGQQYLDESFVVVES